MTCDEVFPAREMHSMLALGADYPCKARDRAFLARALLLMHIRVTEHYPGARYASLQ